MIIVEPHADDAFLSMGGIIERETKLGTKITIVTIYSGTRKRAVDAKAYADAVGASWIGLGAVENGGGIDGGVGNFEPLWRNEIFEPLIHRRFIVPLAIEHPEHFAVRLAFEELRLPMPLWYYVDQPYATKLKNQAKVSEALYGKRIVDIYRPGAMKYRHTKLFKDQSKFFHFNPPTDLEMKGYELVVE